MQDLEKYVNKVIAKIERVFTSHDKRAWDRRLADIINAVIVDFTSQQTEKKTEQRMSLKYSDVLQEWLNSFSMADLSLLSTEITLAWNKRLARGHAGNTPCSHGTKYDCEKCFLPIVTTVNAARIKEWLKDNKKALTETAGSTSTLKLFEK